MLKKREILISSFVILFKLRYTNKETHFKVAFKSLSISLVKGLHKLVGHAVVDVVQRENSITQELVQIWALKTNQDSYVYVKQNIRFQCSPWKQPLP